ncbi:MAG: HEAT repeat domain-containing protein, partial [Pseudomonadota bacterium]
MNAILVLALAAALWPGGEDDSTSDEGAVALAAQAPGRRMAAIVRLGMLARPDGLRRLARLTESDDPSVRLAAERALARAGDAGVLERVAARARDESAPTRFEALTLLREAPALPPSARLAAERALGDADPAMRLLALDLLTVHPARASAPALAGMIADSNREVRLAAIRAVAAAGHPCVILALLDRIDGPDRVERVAIIQALGAVGEHPGLSAGPALLRQLQAQANDASDDVRAAAVDALGRLRWVPAVPALRTVASRPARDFLSRRAIHALAAIGDAVAIDALVTLLGEPGPADDVLRALRRVGSPAVVAIARIVPHAHPTRAEAAATLLGDIGDRRATPALVDALTGRPAIALATARALAA